MSTLTEAVEQLLEAQSRDSVKKLIAPTVAEVTKFSRHGVEVVHFQKPPPAVKWEPIPDGVEVTQITRTKEILLGEIFGPAVKRSCFRHADCDAADAMKRRAGSLNRAVHVEVSDG